MINETLNNKKQPNNRNIETAKIQFFLINPTLLARWSFRNGVRATEN